MGLVDTAIQKRKPKSHTIIEAHPGVYEKMLRDGEWPDAMILDTAAPQTFLAYFGTEWQMWVCLGALSLFQELRTKVLQSAESGSLPNA